MFNPNLFLNNLFLLNLSFIYLFPIISCTLAACARGAPPGPGNLLDNLQYVIHNFCLYLLFFTSVHVLFMFMSLSSIRAGTVIIRLFINYSIPSVHYPCLQNIGNLTFNFFLLFSSLISLNSQYFSIFTYISVSFSFPVKYDSL